MKIKLSLLSALLFLLASCGGGAVDEAPKTPEEVASAFLGAAQAGDQARFQSFFTEGAREGMSSGGGSFTLDQGLDSFEVNPAIHDGDETRVAVTAQVDGERQDLALCMRQVKGQWRIWGFDVIVGTETAMTIDLESIGTMMSAMEDEMANAFQEAFDEVALGGSEDDIRAARQRFDAVAPISAAAFEKGWKRSFRSQGEPASQILGALLTDTELWLEAGAHAEALEQSVTLELAGVSRIQAFEAVCAAVGLSPVYPSASGWENQDKVGFTTARTKPVAFAGPFLVEVAELTENAPNTTGEIQLAVHAFGLPAEVLAYQTEMVQMLAVDSIAGPDGDSVNADEGTQFWGTPTITGAFLTDSLSLDLRLLLRGVPTIDIEGRVLLRFPVDMQEVSWRDADEETRAFGDLTLKRTQWSESPRFELSGLPDFDGYEVRLSPLNAAGEPLGVMFTDASAWGDQMQYGLQTSETPAAVDMKLCRIEEVEYTFVLEDFPLERFAEQPEALEPLSFPGREPLSVSFERFTERGDFPKAELDVTNAANKDVMQAQATFLYLDSAGKELESFPHTLTGEFGFEGHAPLATADSTATQETTVFFMPDGTKTIRIRVDSVTFADASEWTRPE